MAKPKIPHTTTTTTATTTNTTTTNARPFSCSSLHLKIWAIALLSFATSLFIVSRLLSNTNYGRSSWPADCLLQTLMEFNGGDTHSMEGLHGNNAAQMNRHGEHSSLAEHVGALVIRNGDPKEESRVFTGDLRVMEEAWNKLCFGEPPRHERLRLAVFVKKWPVGGVPGGLERHALTLHKVLATWGHTVHVYTMSPDISSNGTTSVVDGTLSVHFFPPTVNNNFDFATALAAFVEQNRRQAFDAVHTESVALPHWRAGRIEEPLIATWHGIAYEIAHTDIVMDLVRKPGEERSPDLVRALSSRLMRVADEVRFFPVYHHHVATSDYVSDVLQTIYELPVATVHTILNGVNTSEFYPDPDKGAAFRARHGVPENASLVLGAAGRLVRDKGHELLFDAFKEVLASPAHPDVYLLVAGQGPWGKRYELLAPRVLVLGSLPPSQLAEFYNAIDIFVNPTMRAQGLDHTLLEAMQCGKPLLATRFSSITRSVIVSPELGYTFSPNVAALSDALKAVLTDGREVLQRKGQACKSYASHMFDAQKMASSYERLFLCLHNPFYCTYPLAFDQSSCNITSTTSTTHANLAR